MHMHTHMHVHVHLLQLELVAWMRDLCVLAKHVHAHVHVLVHVLVHVHVHVPAVSPTAWRAPRDPSPKGAKTCRTKSRRS